jgi:hypothetical protein
MLRRLFFVLVLVLLSPTSSSIVASSSQAAAHKSTPLALNEVANEIAFPLRRRKPLLPLAVSSPRRRKRPNINRDREAPALTNRVAILPHLLSIPPIVTPLFLALAALNLFSSIGSPTARFLTSLGLPPLSKTFSFEDAELEIIKLNKLITKEEDLILIPPPHLPTAWSFAWFAVALVLHFGWKIGPNVSERWKAIVEYDVLPHSPPPNADALEEPDAVYICPDDASSTLSSTRSSSSFLPLPSGGQIYDIDDETRTVTRDHLPLRYDDASNTLHSMAPCFYNPTSNAGLLGFLDYCSSPTLGEKKTDRRRRRRRRSEDAKPSTERASPELKPFLSPSALRQSKSTYQPTLLSPLPPPKSDLFASVSKRLLSPLSVLQLISILSSSFIESDFTLFRLGLNVCAGVSSFVFEGYVDFNENERVRGEILREREEGELVEVDILRCKDRKIKKRNKGKKGRRTPPGCEWLLNRKGTEILPGDVFRFATTVRHQQSDRGSPSLKVPVDALLLPSSSFSSSMTASVIADESTLTGESVPQVKVALSSSTIDNRPTSTEDQFFERNRNAIVFAGTTLYNQQLSCISSGSIFLCLRAGPFSTRGTTLRALLRPPSSASMLSAADSDAAKLVALLFAFSSAACFFLVTSSSSKKSTNRLSALSPAFNFKLFSQLIKILTSSTPTSLPLSLSSSLRTSVARLKEESDVVCNKQSDLLKVGEIDVVVFDKTGTITTDTGKG